MRQAAPILALCLALAACGTSGPTPAENAVLAAENRAGLDGDVVELPAGEGGEIVEDAGPDTAVIARADGWLGRWRGVEGLNLVIERGDAPGRYRLDMQYSIDDKGMFEGRATEQGIAFDRPDGAHVLKAGDGEATGLKWLADKQDCLVVKPSEGYCRD